MKAVKKQVQIFMTPADEEAFSRALRSERPGVRFIDDNVWPTAEPPTCDSINSCGSNLVYLWDTKVCGRLPATRRAEGGFQGPASGPVIQFVRSLVEDEQIRSGRVAAGYYDTDEFADEMKEFVRDVWHMLKSVSPQRLVAVAQFGRHVINSRPSGYLVGADAARWCRDDSRRVLKDRSTETYFLPAPE
jgi:hypothetical protein